MTLFVDDTDFRLHVGDVLDVLPTLEAGSVDCVVTSPPYWGLRDYGTGRWDGGNPDCDHLGPPKASESSGLKNDGRPVEMVGQNEYERGAKVPYRDVCGKCGARRVDQQLGLEATPDLYVENMVNVFREVRRVLADHGTVWLNLGDSYTGGLGGRSWNLNSGVRDGAKDAHAEIGRYHKHEVPGLKPKDLVGIPWRVAFALQADGWYLRADIVWAKPNPMPESVTDRPTKSHEYVFLLAKQPRYWFDQEAVREQHESTRWGGPTITQPPDTKYAEATANGFAGAAEALSRPGRKWNAYPQGGRNIRSVWEIATQPYAEAHFATYPEELVRRCLLAGCPVGGTVLDPFLGSGTTALVARKDGRRCVGVELNPVYAELAARRLQQLSLLA